MLDVAGTFSVATVSAAGMKMSPHDKLFKEAFESPRNGAAQLRTVLPSGMIDIIDSDAALALSTRSTGARCSLS